MYKRLREVEVNCRGVSRMEELLVTLLVTEKDKTIERLKFERELEMSKQLERANTILLARLPK